MAKRAKKRARIPQTEAADATVDDHRLPVWLRVAVIVVFAVFIYWPALNGAWLWDDRDLLPDNSLIKDPNGFWKIWLEPGVLYDYLPLKVSVEWIEWRLFGEWTVGYHVVNLLLHITNALLFWRLLAKLGLRFAWIGGLIFAVHPVLVESVAWIAELKNTLSLPFFLMAMSAWIDFDPRRGKHDFALALVLFFLAMLCKPTMVMFPLVMLLYAWWKRGRVGREDLLASVPFFAISLLIGLVTIWFLGHTDGEKSVVLGGPLSRLACAGLSIAFYFSKCVLPLDLMTIYPKWNCDSPSLLQFLPWPILAGALFFLWTKRASWGRHALLSVGFFLLNLIPFIGLNAGSYMAYTWVMDHLLYIPILGLIGLAVAALGEIRAKVAATSRHVVSAIVAVAIALMTWSAHSYAAIYIGPEALWGYNVAVNPGAALPHNDLGFAYLSEGRTAEATEQFRLALRLNPDYLEAHHNLGLVLLQINDFPGALAEFQAVLKLNPHLAESHRNVADVLSNLGRNSEAIVEYRQALALDPESVATYNDLAIALNAQNQTPEAVEILRDGLKISPNDPILQGNLNAMLARLNQSGAAPLKTSGQ